MTILPEVKNTETPAEIIDALREQIVERNKKINQLRNDKDRALLEVEKLNNQVSLLQLENKKLRLNIVPFKDREKLDRQIPRYRDPSQISHIMQPPRAISKEDLVLDSIGNYRDPLDF